METLAIPIGGSPKCLTNSRRGSALVVGDLMPLNRITGERLEGMTTRPVIEPLSKWSDTKFWEFAAERADKAFGLAMSKRKSFRKRVRVAVNPFIWSETEVSVQIYPYERTPMLYFLFCKVINGKEKYWWIPFVMTPQLISELRLAGRWPSKIEVLA